MKLSVKSGSAIAAAAASLMLANAVVSTTVLADEAMGHCVGANACKGQGACKGASNACKGRNACKGQGFTEFLEGRLREGARQVRAFKGLVQINSEAPLFSGVSEFLSVDAEQFPVRLGGSNDVEIILAGKRGVAGYGLCCHEFRGG